MRRNSLGKLVDPLPHFLDALERLGHLDRVRLSARRPQPPVETVSPDSAMRDERRQS